MLSRRYLPRLVLTTVVVGAVFLWASAAPGAASEQRRVACEWSALRVCPLARASTDRGPLGFGRGDHVVYGFSIARNEVPRRFELSGKLAVTTYGRDRAGWVLRFALYDLTTAEVTDALREQLASGAIVLVGDDGRITRVQLPESSGARARSVWSEVLQLWQVQRPADGQVAWQATNPTGSIRHDYRLESKPGELPMRIVRRRMSPVVDGETRILLDPAPARIEGSEQAIHGQLRFCFVRIHAERREGLPARSFGDEGDVVILAQGAD